MRILIIGDFHYPDRADFPNEIFEYLNGEKFDLVLCTGDLTELSILDELKKFGPVKIVQGNMDWKFKHPNKHVISIKNLKIGLIHGHQVHPRGNLEKLSALAKSMGVNILISGHTHKQSIIKYAGGKLLINPGSASGAWSFVADGIPSFIIMETDEENVFIEKIRLINNNFERESLSFKISDLK